MNGARTGRSAGPGEGVTDEIDAVDVLRVSAPTLRARSR